jgi:hypothetical protein
LDSVGSGCARAEKPLLPLGFNPSEGMLIVAAGTNCQHVIVNRSRRVPGKRESTGILASPSEPAGDAACQHFVEIEAPAAATTRRFGRREATPGRRPSLFRSPQYFFSLPAAPNMDRLNS